MSKFFELLWAFWSGIIALMNNTIIMFDGISVPLGYILFAFMVIGFVVSIFWKGARA